MSKDRLPPDAVDTLQATFPPASTEAWRRTIREDLGEADGLERLTWKPLEGFSVQPFYRAEDLETLPRGLMQAARPIRTDGNAWHIRQDLALYDLPAANRRAREALSRGATTLGFIVEAQREPMRQETMARLLDGIPLETTPLHWASLGAARPLLAMLFNEAARRGVPLDALRGSVTTDPATHLARLGTLDAGPAFDEAARLLDEVATTGAGLHTLRVAALPFHNAGASGVQELAFTLAVASEYVAHLTERGVSADAAVRGLRFVVPVGTSYFMEIAWLRALRVLFGQLVRAYGGQDAHATPCVDAVASPWSLTRYDPHSNLLRATTQAAAAIIGGCDTLTLLPHDAALGPSSETAFRLARNVQLILKHEAHLDAVADPAAGSYYVETLTDKLARHAWALFQQVEARGGLFKALEDGFVQRQIQTVREHREQDVASGRRVFVGVNAFPDFDEETPGETTSPVLFSPSTAFSFDPETPLEALCEALQTGATLADLPAVSASGVALEAAPLPKARGAEAFEALRLRTDRHTRQTGRRPTVFLLRFGTPAPANARATFSRNVFGCAGFSILESPVTDSIPQGARAALASGADVVVLCSADETYARLAPEVSARLKAAGSNALLVVAGYPEEQIDSLKAAGVDALIHANQNFLETLEKFQASLGIQR